VATVAARTAGGPATGRAPFVSVALVSGAALAYELLLLRLFSIIQWHHFAYMVISLALIGLGASGTFLALMRERLLPRISQVFVSCLALFGPAAAGCYALAQQVGFNTEEIFWDPGQLLRLVIIYLLLAVPFFFAGCAIGIALMGWRESIPRLYGADLAGAGIGSIALMTALTVVFPLQALSLIALAGSLALLVAVWELRLRWRISPALIFALMALPALAWPWRADLVVSPYKPLSQALRIAGATVLEQRSSPLGLLTVVSNERVPLRHAPGLSLQAPAGPPPQLGLYVDAGAVSPITAWDPTAGTAHFGQLTSALPYYLVQPGRVLVLGAGGGGAVQQALALGAERVDAVELNSQVSALVRDQFGAFAHGLFQNPRVRLHTADARGFVSTDRAAYDLIQLDLVDALGSSAAGLNALGESYLFTVEAMEDYLARLSPGGMLATTRWVRVPPRDALKLLATAAEALRMLGSSDPGKHIVLIRGWATSTLLVKKTVLTDQELRSLRRFCARRGFDLAYDPSIRAEEANRYNVLRRPWFHDGAVALLGNERQGFLARYKFNLTPATDDRPYFGHFFKFKTLPEALSLRGRGGAALVEWGYLVLVATLLQALVGSALLVLLPLTLLQRARPAQATLSTLRLVTCFAAIGLAFLFIEMAFIQRFTLFLHHPLYAAVAVLSAFLIFAGLGSLLANRLAIQRRARAWMGFAVIGISLLASIDLALFGTLFELFAGHVLWAKLGIAIILVAPLAFCMGLPLPLALAQVASSQPALLPWAWAINGCASVVSAVLAVMLAIQFGFTLVLILAVLLYALAGLTFPGNALQAEDPLT